MIHVKIPFFLFFVFWACIFTLAERQGPRNGMMNGFNRRGQGNGGMRGFQGGRDQGFGEIPGGNGRQSYGGQDTKKYRTNLYNDGQVYGYDAIYPNGEAAYINYRSKEARTRRGPEFARTSRAYSRQGANGERGNNIGQMNEYNAGGTW